jgi:uncharacterized phiE125 gp8 family phage protein
MPLVLKLTSEPAVEPLSVDDAKTHMRIDIDAEDAYIAVLIKSARLRAEAFINKQLITATYTLKLDSFPSVISIPRSPAQEITSITYVDTDGDTQTLSSDVYTLDSDSEPGRIYEAYGESWPSHRPIRNAITVTFKAGYGDAAANVPDDIIHAIKLFTAAYHEEREEGNDRNILINKITTAERLLYPYKIVKG